MKHFPFPGSSLLRWAGDRLDITLTLDEKRHGRAAFRTNIGGARVRRGELIAHTESGAPILACDWHDVPMEETAPGVFHVSLLLTEVGLFSGKACFFPEGSDSPKWAEGENLRVKVEPARTACANTMYTVFVRQFGPSLHENPRTPLLREEEEMLDKRGYTVIPPSGTFRDVIARLHVIMDMMHFRILQLLPIHPTPTVYGRMGRYGSPFAGLDFLSVDPSLAVFDTRATPLDQFRELIDAVHAREGFLYMDLPANHTGWAATLQTHHPEWYKRTEDGAFASPGAWGVTWADLVELDFNAPKLRAYMADVFLFWCRQGVDGFRCDAGYMIPVETWTYIVARVREEFPDTVFLLEGLGGPVDTTRRLLEEAGLDWAYSELFQTETRGALDAYLPGAISLAERCGPLIHFAETHDNNRIAARGETYARIRVMLSALLSHQGAFGIANGVEWLADEKIDVHGASALRWDGVPNLVDLLARLNTLLASHPAFGPETHLRAIQTCGGECLAVLREAPKGENLLVLVNLDAVHSVPVSWDAPAFPCPKGAWDLLGDGETCLLPAETASFRLAPGQVLCLSASPARKTALSYGGACEPPAIAARRAALLLARCGKKTAECLEKDPSFTVFRWSVDTRREVVIPCGNSLLLLATHPFQATVTTAVGHTLSRESAFCCPVKEESASTWILPLPCAPYSEALDGSRAERRFLEMTVYTPAGIQRSRSVLLIPPSAGRARIRAWVSGEEARADFALCTGASSAYGKPREAFTPLYAVLSNGAGAMAQVPAAWGAVRSQYDCLLGMNLDANVPVDKTVFWTRCRAWLRRRGFSEEINLSCLSRFSADPAGRFAEWRFRVPCGMGHWVPLTFRLALAPLRNVARLCVIRPLEDGKNVLASDEPVTVILRPDIEWRSFHTPTKAFQGAEYALPAAIRPDEKGTGFLFSLQGAPEAALSVSHGGWHMEPEWTYMLPHPEEAERGLDGAGDLFSPGWFDLPLAGGQRVEVTAGERAQFREAEFPGLAEEEKERGFVDALSAAMDLYVVKRDSLKTVIAGYPWFLDWGRDTLIVLRGLIADARLADVLAILTEFGRFEENGTLPNIIHGNTVGNRDTVDAPLWFCVVAGDLMAALHDDGTVLNHPVNRTRTFRDVLLSIVTHFRDGTPNGIRMDPASGLLYSPPHFTWMDTNYPAATPREGYPVDIQALWIASLRLVAEKIDPAFSVLAEKAICSVKTLYRLPGGGYADCLRAGPGVPAAQAEVEDTVRPNQLLLLTLGIFPGEEGILSACEPLLLPGAIRSLADAPVQCDMGVWRDGVLLNDPHAPYRGVYRGDEDTQRKPAYHNGTAWTLPFPLYAEALVYVRGPAARTAAASLLASSVELLNRGCLGHLPEICDGDAPHFARGCGAQAWGMSELLRVAKLLGSSLF